MADVKFLLNMLDRLRPTFTEGGLKLLHPAFDAIDTFLFSVPDRTEIAPHVRGPMSVKRYMSVVMVAVMPLVLLSIYTFGYQVLANLVLTFATGLTIELLFAIVRKEQINEGFFVTGLLFPLIIPPNLHWAMVISGTAFGVLVAKELFGGTGRNLFNPALVGRCFLLLGFSRHMGGGWSDPVYTWPGRLMDVDVMGYVKGVSLDAYSGATPLAAAKNGTYADLCDMAAGNVSGSAGEMFVPLIVIGGLLILVTRVGSWRSVLATLGSFVVLSVVLTAAVPASFGLTDSTTIAFGSDTVIRLSTATVTDRIGSAAWLTLWHALAGGLLFGVVYMVTDPITSPFSKLGKWIYGMIIGGTTVLFRHLGGYVEGVMFAILLGNVCAPILDEIAVALHLRRLRDER